MATNIIKRTMPNGRQIMIKFGYADNNGEYYTRFADASYQNFDRGATYAAFVSHSHPDSLPCWEMDEEYGFEDRALTAEEKKWFEKNYFQTHPSKEAFDFMVDVQDELKRRCKDTDATVDGFDEGCKVNLEVDVLARYLERLFNFDAKKNGTNKSQGSGITMKKKNKNGFI